MFGFLKRTVRVTFVDAGTGALLANSDVPIDQLPDSFAIATQLDLAGQKYSVVRAAPESKAEFARTKQLKVELSKVESISPHDILFSLPSICGAALPATEEERKGGLRLQLSEDDWRQCEFVATAHAAAIDAELEAIRRIHATSSTGMGWSKVHVRESIDAPLPRGISWPEVLRHLPVAEAISAVGLGDAEVVSGAVGARLADGVSVWGVARSGELTALCVESLAGASPTTAAALRALADHHSLVLVHWCRCQAYTPESITLRQAHGLPWDPL